MKFARLLGLLVVVMILVPLAYADGPVIMVFQNVNGANDGQYYVSPYLGTLNGQTVRLFCDDDIVVVTSYKAGTTWMQGIVANLIFSGRELPASLFDMSPWVDMRVAPLELVLTGLEQQTHRRFMKLLNGRT